MANVFRSNEISLFDKYYPTIGAVEPFIASQFGQKEVTGDFSKDDQTLLSSWVVSDQRGGIGIKDMLEREDADRCWWSTCSLYAKGHIVLPVLTTSTTNPGTADPVVTIEYDNEQYTAFGTAIHKWNNGTASWGSSLTTAPAAVTDAIVHKGKLYFACTSDFKRFDGTTWTDGATLGSAQKSRYFVEWDSKLFNLDNDGQLDHTSNEGAAWSASGASPLDAGDHTSLFLYRDLSGNMIIYMGTKVGVFALDYDNTKWVETELTMPFHDQACLGSTRWREYAHVPVGLSVTRYHASSHGVEISYMGLDRDHGILGDYRGNIVDLATTQNELFALVDATSTVEQDTFPAAHGNVYGNVQVYDNVGFSALFRWDGYAWSVAYTSASTATEAKCMAATTADDEYRLWFGIDGTMHYLPLQKTIQNPLEVTDFPFGASAEHITPWFDADNSVTDKIGVRLSTLVQDATTTEYVKVYYGTDDDDDTWTALTSTTYSDGQIDSSGVAEFTFASDVGINFKSVRFKFELYRGSSTGVSPDIRWARLDYMKVLPTRYGYKVRVNCSRNHRFQTSKTLVSNLKTAKTTNTLGNFQFRDGDDSDEPYKVRIMDINGAEVGGKHIQGIYDIVLVAP